MRCINNKSVIEWISEHDQLFDDLCNYFNLDPDSENIADDIDLTDVLSWLSEHVTAMRDFMAEFTDATREELDIIEMADDDSAMDVIEKYLSDYL